MMLNVNLLNCDFHQTGNSLTQQAKLWKRKSIRRLLKKLYAEFADKLVAMIDVCMCVCVCG